MSNTDRMSMLERWADGMEKLEQFYEGKYGPPATPPSLPPITTYDGMLEAIADGLQRAKRNINKKSPTYHSDSVAYVKTVPSGDVHYAPLEQIGGKTIVWNQLVDTGTTTVNTISGHKYYKLIDGTASVITSDGTAITVVDDTADMVTDLTLCYGSGNEPSTVEEFQQMFPASYYPYNTGTLLSAGVTEVVSKKADTTEIATYPIPAEIQALEGYGWSAGQVYNYIDYERKVFVKRVGKVVLDGTQTIKLTNWRPDSSGVGWAYAYELTNNKTPATNSSKINAITNSYEYKTYTEIYGHSKGIAFADNVIYGIFLWQSDATLTNATAINNYLSANPLTVYYELATPIETDISAYITDDTLIEVEAGGTLTFENANGDDYRIPVPSSETFVVGEP